MTTASRRAAHRASFVSVSGKGGAGGKRAALLRHSTALVPAAMALAAAGLLAMPGAALAQASGGNGGNSPGSGGAGSATGAGNSGATTGNSGGGGGAGATGGSGGAGGAPGGATAGGNGFGAVSPSGGGGGGAHGYVGATIPGAAAVGGNGGGGGVSASGSGRGGGGGGGGGSGAVVTGTGDLGTLSVSLIGGVGGQGGNGGTGSFGGSGGFGGMGLALTGNNASITVNNSVTGGNGGSGGAVGTAGAGAAGVGGRGGVGLQVLGSNAVITIGASGSVTGGNGGPALNGAGQGFGGAGITGSSLSLIVSGSVSGGTGVFGRENAITFTGGTNILEIRSGATFNGSVVANSGVDTLRLGGTVNGTLSAGQIGSSAQFRNFGVFEKVGSSTWTLTDSTSAATPWAINGGTLSIASDGALGASGPISFNGGTLVTTAGFTSARNITLNAGGGTISPATGTIYTVSGILSGSGSLTKDGAGTLVLSGQNTYSGGTVISGGTLRIGSDANLGAASGGITINNAELNFTSALTTNRAITLNGTASINSNSDVTLGGVISGTGTLTRISGGTLTLTNTNDYSGGTFLNNTALQIGNGGTSGTLGSGTVTLNSSTLIFNRSDDITVANDIISSGNVTKRGAGTVTLTGIKNWTGNTTVEAGTLALRGTAGLNGNGFVQITGGTLDMGVNGLLSSVTHSAGTLALGGTTLSTFFGNYTFSGGSITGNGTIRLGSNSRSFAISNSASSIGADITIASTGVNNSVTIANVGDYTLGAAIIGSGALDSLNSIRVTINNPGFRTTLSGNSNYAMGTTVTAGTLALGSDTALGTGTLLLNPNTVLTSVGLRSIANPVSLVAGTILIENTDTTNTFTLGGVISGAGFTKTGAGTLVLSGTNTYSGETAISAGTIVVTNLNGLGTAGATFTGVDTKLVADFDGILPNPVSVNTGATATFAAANGRTVTFRSLGIKNGTTLRFGSATEAGTIVWDPNGFSYSGFLSPVPPALVIGGGIFRLAGNNAAPAFNLFMDPLGSFEIAQAATLDTNGKSVNLRRLTGLGTVANTGAANTLTIGHGFGFGGTFDTGANGITLAGSLTGLGNFTKTGAGILTLASTLDTSGFTGGLTLASGTLSLRGNLASTFGAITTTGSVIDFGDGVSSAAPIVVKSNDTQLQVTTGTATQSGVISETGGARPLAKIGAGTLVLSGANTYSGETVVEAGTLVISEQNGLGSAAAGTTVRSGATLAFANGSGFFWEQGEALTINGAGVNGQGALQGRGGSLGFANPLTLGSDSTISVSAGTLGFAQVNGNNHNLTALVSSGELSAMTVNSLNLGTGTLTKDGAGRLTLFGPNSWTGNLIVNAGIIQVGSSLVAANGAIGDNAEVVLNGGTFLLGMDETIGSLSGAVGSRAQSNLVRTLTTGGNNLSTSFDGIVSGSLNLTKVGTGTMTLSGVNTYSGLTTVSAGTLIAASDGALGSSAGGTVVQSGATLVVNGGVTNSEAITINGTGVGGLGALRFAGANTTVGTITLGSDARIGFAGSGRIISSGIVGNGNALTIGSVSSLDLGGGQMTGLSSLTYEAGNHVLRDVTINGPVFLQSGASLVTTGAISGASFGRVNLAAGSTLNVGVATGAGSIDGLGHVNLVSRLTVGSDNSSTTIGSISGGEISTLTKVGTGTLTVAGSYDFWDDIVVEAGTLQIGNGGAGGAFTLGETNRATASAVINGTLAINRSDDVVISDTAASISGTGNLIQRGTGALTLSGANTYSGLTTVERGTLIAASNGALGSSAGGTVVQSGATLVVNGGVTNSEAITINGSGVGGLGALRVAGPGLATIGSIALGSNATIDVGGFPNAGLSYSSILGGGFELTAVGRGSLIGQITNISSFIAAGTRITLGSTNITAPVFVNSGTLVVGGNASIGDTTRVTVAAGATLEAQGETIGSVNGAGAIVLGAINQTLTLGGDNTSFEVGSFVDDALEGSVLRKIGSGTFTVAGEYRQLVGLEVLQGTLQIGNGGAGGSVTLGDVNFGGFSTVNGTLAFNRSDNIDLGALSGAISGTGNLIQRGTGILTLANSNTLSGAVTVEAGTLVLTGANSFGSITVGGGTLRLANNLAANGANGIIRTTGSVVDYAAGITMATPLELRSDTTQLQVLTGSATQSGVISETGGARPIEKIGAGVLILNAANTFTGDTLVSAGELQVTGGSALSNTGRVTIAAGAILRLVTSQETIGSLEGGGQLRFEEGGSAIVGDASSTTFSGTITQGGPVGGAFIKRGTGTLTLSGANTYAAQTRVEGGTLRITNGSGLGTIAGGTIVSSGASLLFVGSSPTPNIAEALTISGTGQNGGGAIRIEPNAPAGSQGVNLTGGVTLAGDATITVTDLIALNFNTGGIALGGNTLTFASEGTGNSSIFVNSAISGTGGLIKNGLSGLTLSGTNTFTGPLTINGDTVTVSGGTALADTVAVTVGSGAILNVLGSETIGSLTGSGRVILRDSETLTVGGNNTSTTYSGTGLNGIVGTGNLAKIGTGTLTLTGANTYSGTTTISGGTLALQGGAALSDTGQVFIDTFGTLRVEAGETIGGIGGPGSIVLATTGPLVVNAQQNLTYSGVISQSGVIGSFTKRGGATQTITAAQTFTGQTSVEAGQLALTGSGALASTSISTSTGARLTTDGGALASDAVINHAGILTLSGSETIGSISGTGAITLFTATLSTGNASDATLSGIISGTNGALIKTGTGTLTLSGANTYNGGTTISAGTLVLNQVAGGTIGAAGTSQITIASGGNLLSNVTGTLANRFFLSSSTDASIAAASGTTLTLTGDQFVTAPPFTLTFGSSSATGTIDLAMPSGVTIGAGMRATIAGGTVRIGTPFGGSVFSLASGGTTIGNSTTAATLDANGISFVLARLNGSAAGTLTNTGSQAANISLNNQSDTTFAGTITNGASALNLVKAGPGTLTLTGDNTYTGTTGVSSGTLSIGNGGTTGTLGSGAVSVISTGTLVLNRSNGLTLANTFNGLGTLRQIGTGTTTITGDSSGFSGTTSVEAGSLLVNGSLGGTINVTGGTLGGTGTLGSVTIGNGGTLAAGQSPGTISFGSLTLDAGSETIFELAAAGVEGGPSNDLIRVTGNLTLNGGAISIVRGTGFSAGQYTLFRYGLLTGPIGNLTLNPLDGGFGGSLALGLDTVLLNVAGAADQVHWNGSTFASANTIVGGSGTWNLLSSNFSNAAGTVSGPWAGNGALAIFGGASGGTVTIAADTVLSPSGLNFTTTGYTIAGANAGSRLALTGPTGIDTSAGVSATISAVIEGAGSVTKTGAGSLTLGGANTFTGGTSVLGGTLLANTSGALGTGAAGVTVADGATLSLGIGTTITKALTLNGLGVGAAGALQVNSAAQYDGAITLGSASRIFGNGGFVNDIATDFALSLAGRLTVEGAITGSGGITVEGFGDAILSGTNSYAGTTTINALASLSLSGSGTFGTGNVINNGSILINRSSDGTIANAISGAGSLQVLAGGTTTTLTGANSYAGQTTIVLGTLIAANNTALGTAAGGTVVQGAATLGLQGGIAITGEALTLNGNGVGGLGNLRNFAGNNSFTGPITLGASSLIASDAGLLTLGGIALGTNSLTVAGSGNTTIGGAISGSGALTKQGAGTLTLSGNNTPFTGAIAVLGGTLGVGAGLNLGNVAATSAITIDGGTLRTTGSFATNRSLTIGAGGGTIDVQTGIVNVFGNVTFTGELVKTGAGRLFLSGFNNSGAGGVRVEQGGLAIARNTSLGTGTLTLGTGAELFLLQPGLTLNNGIVLGGGAGSNIDPFNNVDPTTLAGVLSGGQLNVVGGAGRLVLTGANTYGATTVAAGNTLQIGNGGTTGTLGTGGVTLTAANSALVFNRSNDLTVVNVISGLGTLTKQGTGTLTLTGANTYTGGTTISAGTLRVSSDANLGGNARNTVTLNGGTLLAAGPLTINGRIGAAGGTINVEGTGFVNSVDTVFDGLLTKTTTAVNGTVILFGTGTGNGGVLLDKGYLQLFNPGAMGTGRLTMAEGTLLGVNDSPTAVQNAITLGGGAGSSIGAIGAIGEKSILAGEISGGSLTFSGLFNGTLVLTGNNTYTGTTTINGRTLQIGDGGTSGTLGGGAVFNNTSLVFNRSNDLTVGNLISGLGTLTKQGAGTLTLTGANTYSGETRVDAGTLAVATGGTIAGSVINNAAFTNAGTVSGSVTNSGTLTSTGTLGGGLINQTGANASLAGAVNGGVQNSGTITLTGTTTGITTFTQAATGVFDLAGFATTIGGLVGAGEMRLGSGNLTVNTAASTDFSGVISGSGGLIKTGTATLTLSGANTFTGPAVINAGSIFLATGASLAGGVENNATFINSGSVAGLVTNTATLISDGSLNGGLTNAAGASAQLANTARGPITNAGTITLTANLGGGAALTQQGTGAFSLAGFNATLGSIAGDGTIALGVGTLTSGSSNTSTSFGGVISGAGTLVKTGTGTLTLAGVNTYTGTTEVAEGALTLAAGGVIAGRVRNDATFTNAGTVSGGVTNTATLTSTGTINGGLAQFAGASATVSGTLNGAISSAGTLIVNGNLVSNDFGQTSGTGITQVLGGVTWSGLTGFTHASTNATGLVIAGTLDVSGIVTTAAGATTIIGGGGMLRAQNMANLGTVTNNGTVNSDVTNYAALTNAGTWNGGLSQAQGNAANAGTWNGFFLVDAGGTVTNNGVWDNSTAFLSAVRDGLFENAGTLSGLGVVVSGTDALLANLAGGTVTLDTGEVLRAGGGGTITNAGTITGAGTIDAGGVIRNLAGGSWSGALSIAANGRLDNAGAITGTVTNAGIFSNTGIVSGSVSNSGTLTSTGTLSGGLINQTGGTASLAGAVNGSVQNSGTIALTGATTGITTFVQASGGVFNLFGFATTLGSLSGSGTISLGAAGLTVGGNGADTRFDGVIAGSGTLTKTGTGLLVLGGANSFTGLTTINAGTLTLASGGVLAGAVTNAASFGNAGTVNGLVTNTGALVSTGTLAGGLVNAAGATATLAGVVGGDITNAGTITLDSGFSAPGTVTQSAAGVFDITRTDATIGGLAGAGSVLLGARTLQLGGNDASTSFAGSMGGSGGITKLGTGTLTLNAVQTFTGLTTVSGGTLAVSGTGGLAGAVLNAATLTNAGTIGGQVSNTASLTNTGTIAGQVGNAAGASATNSGTIGGSLVNAGTFSNSGIVSGGVSNSGTLTSTGTLSGELVNLSGGTASLAGAVNGGVQNSGAITLTGATSGIGLFDQAAGGSFDLAGFDTALGGLAGAGSVVLGAARLTTGSGNSGTIFAGVISGSGSLTKTGTGTFVLSGANTYAGGTTIAGGALQIGAGGTTGSIIGPVVNNGALVISRSDAVTFASLVSGTGMLVQDGTGTTTLTAANTYTGGTLVNRGRLVGTTTVLQGLIQINAGAALEFAQGPAGTFAGSLLGAGLFEKTGAGLLTLTGNSNAFTGATSVRAGELRVNGGLAGSVVTVGTGARLSGTGVIGGLIAQSGSTIAPGTSPGVLGVAGNVTLQAGSTSVFEVSAAGPSDLILATGTASLGGTAALINLGGTYGFGSQITLVQADGGRSGTFANVTGLEGFGIRYRPELVYVAGQARLRMAPNTLANIAGTAALTANQRSVVSRIDGAVAAGYNPDPLFNIYSLPAAQLPGAFDQLSGEAYATAAGVGIEQERLVREAVLGRINAVAAVAHSAPEAAKGIGAWGQLFGGWGDGESDGNAAAFEADRMGFVTGLDIGNASENGSWRVGAFGMRVQSDVTIAARGSRAEVNQAGGGAYAALTAGGFGLSLGGYLSAVDLRTFRNIALPGFADNLVGTTEGKARQAFAELSYTIEAGDAQIRPFVAGSAGRLTLDTLTERGGAAALAMRDQRYDTGTVTGGIDAAVPVGKVLRLGGALAARRHLGDRDPQAQLALAAAPQQAFAVQGAQIDRTALSARLDAMFTFEENLSITLGYSGLIGNTQTDHAARATIEVRF